MACFEGYFDFLAFAKSNVFDFDFITCIFTAELFEEVFPRLGFLTVEFRDDIFCLDAGFLRGALWEDCRDLESFVGIFAEGTEESEGTHGSATTSGFSGTVCTASDQSVFESDGFGTAFDSGLERVSRFLIADGIEDTVEVRDRFVVQ